MTEQTPNPEMERLQRLGAELQTLQAEKNDGRGVSCVRTVVTYLEMGKLDKAQAVCWNESDKMHSYPDIQKFIVENVFGEEKHPWWLSYKG
jgi:hypothetical protein